MRNMLVYPIGRTKACQYACSFLQKAGVELVDHPTPEITHLLLDVPSFDAEGNLRDGGRLEPILDMLPNQVTVVGGNLLHPALQNATYIDLLTDPAYLAQNAAITADCALRIASEKMATTFRDTPVLVIGWGRIGKCLSRLLKSMDSPVTVAARKEHDRAMLQALGFHAIDILEIPKQLSNFRLIYNTVPHSVLQYNPKKPAAPCQLIDLASNPGIEGGDVLIARGLPGKYAPESSGKLIAQTIVRISQEVTA